MPVCRLTGSDHSIPPAATTRSSGAVTARRNVHAQMATAIQPQLAGEQAWSARQQNRQDTVAEPPADVTYRRARVGRPRFARLHASLAERPLEWAWPDTPDNAGPPGTRERGAARRAQAGLSAGRLWLGGIGFALLAIGVIAAMATIQSTRPLPFETWARQDLMQGARELAGGVSTDVMGAGQFASPPMSELGSVVAGLRLGAAASIPVTAERDPADAALAPEPGREPPEVHIAALGPILASAAAAAQLAAEWPVAPTPQSRSERLLGEPPRPVFKPTLLASSQPEADAKPRPQSRP